MQEPAVWGGSCGEHGTWKSAFPFFVVLKTLEFLVGRGKKFFSPYELSQTIKPLQSEVYKYFTCMTN